MVVGRTVVGSGIGSTGEMNLVDVCGTASSAGPEEVRTDTEVLCTSKELICDNRLASLQ